VGLDDGLRWADCGTSAFVGENFASYGEYTVVVRAKGDSASTVRFTPRWTVRDGSPCTTRGVWESEAEQEIAALAEGRVAGAPPSDGSDKGAPTAPKVTYSYVRALRPTWIMDAPNGSRTILRLQAGTTLVVLGARNEAWVNVAAGVYRGYVAAKDIEDQR
jgi:hypothetical protein